MAYQNFYTESDNGKRQTPAVCSGKQMDFQFKCRQQGESHQLIRVSAWECPSKILNICITIVDPKTGEVLFDRVVEADK